jgi:Arc/MetJ family transcription regulator
MRTTVALDDELLARAEQLTNVHEKSALLREALKALIEREAARRLARLGGTEPQLRPIPRRRPPQSGSIISAVGMLAWRACLTIGKYPRTHLSSANLRLARYEIATKYY